MAEITGIDANEEKALEGIAVAPPSDPSEESPMTEVREAVDAESHQGLKDDPSDPDAKLDIALDETFPTSDPPANTQPGSGEPAESSGYDAAAEQAIAAGR